MSNLDQIINGEQPEQETPVEVTAPEPEPTEVEATQDAEKPEAEAEAPAHKDEPQTVPVGVVQELRRELRELKAAQSQREATPPPDIFEDPKGYQDYVQMAVQNRVDNVKLDISEEMTRTQHGDEVVDAAFSAFQQASDPALHQQILNSRNPWGSLVKWHQGQELAREIGGDPAAYKAKVEAELRAKIEAEIATKQARDAAGKFAPSMANVTGTGGGPKTNWTGPASLSSVLGE